MEGLVEGSLEDLHEKDALACIDDAFDAGKDIEAMVHDFEQKKIIKGLFKISKVVKDAKNTLKGCKGVPTELKDKLEDIEDLFSSPARIAFHVGKDIALNGIDIGKHIFKGIKAYKAQDFEKAGEMFGYAGLEVLYGNAGERTISEAAKSTFVILDAFTAHIVGDNYKDEVLYNSISQAGPEVMDKLSAKVHSFKPNVSSATVLDFVHGSADVLSEALGKVEPYMDADIARYVYQRFRCLSEMEMEDFDTPTYFVAESAWLSYRRENFDDFGEALAQIGERKCKELEE